MPRDKNYNEEDLEDRRLRGDRMREELDFEYEQREEMPDEEEPEWMNEPPPLEIAPEIGKQDVPVPIEAAGNRPVERDAAPNPREPTFRSIKEIITDLSRPIAPRHIQHRQQGRNQIDSISWYTAVRYLDYYAPGWEHNIRSIQVFGNRIVVISRIIIHAAEGIFYRDATGQELLDTDSWGDPSSNAEAMALKRAAAKFGLGLHLYLKDG
jgi:hypothetical protein